MVVLAKCAEPSAPDAGPFDAGPQDAGQADAGCSAVRIAGPFAGDLYIDGGYTGLTTPVSIERWSGERRIAIGSADAGYFEALVDPVESCEVTLPASARRAAREWQARLVLLRDVSATF